MAAVEIENDQRRYLVTIDAGNHNITHQRRTGRDESRTKRTDTDPGPACEFEILGNAAIEIKTDAEIGGMHRLDRITQLIDAFLIERRRGQFRPTPIARRDVRSLGSNLQL